MASFGLSRAKACTHPSLLRQPLSRNLSSLYGDTFFQKAFKLFGFKGRVTVGSAKTILFNCKEQANNQIWYTKGSIGSEFRSKHTVLLMHIWMINRRLLIEGKEGKLIQECLFDELWEDTCARIRSVGIGELSVNKNLKDVQGYSFRFCVELDHALSLADPKHNPVTVPVPMAVGSGTATGTAEDETSSTVTLQGEEAVLDAMGGTLWRLLYLRRTDPSLTEDHVLQLARYLRREQLSLMQLSRDAVLDGRIRWGTPPSWDNNNSNNSSTTTVSTTRESTKKKDNDYMEDTDVEGMEIVDDEWREAIAPDGRTYYWNTITRESRWHRHTDTQIQTETKTVS
eukprot:gene4358-8671_t